MLYFLHKTFIFSAKMKMLCICALQYGKHQQHVAADQLNLATEKLNFNFI